MSSFGFFNDADANQQAFRTLCQDPACRQLLGSMHVPCTAGRVLFVCHHCGGVSEFRVTADGITARLVGRTKASVPSGERPRQLPPEENKAPVVVRPRRVPGIKP